MKFDNIKLNNILSVFVFWTNNKINHGIKTILVVIIYFIFFNFNFQNSLYLYLSNICL